MILFCRPHLFHFNVFFLFGSLYVSSVLNAIMLNRFSSILTSLCPLITVYGHITGNL